MTYETFLAVVEKTKRVKLSDAMIIIENLYRQAALAEEAIEEYYKIYDLFDLLLQQPVFIGNADDYHNLAVVCAKQDDFDSACRFLDEGLKRYPFCVDLLSDYLNYGMQCDKKNQCEDIYIRLISKKDDWNWRAYRFTIDYLINLSNMDFVNREAEIMSLIKDYQEKLPDDEDSYLVHAEFLSRKAREKKEVDGEERMFVKILTYVTSDNSPVGRTPKCDLKLADYYYNNGVSIGKAIQLLERCKKNSIEVQPSVNRSYVYLLSALCKMTQYYEISQSDNEAMENLAMEVYKNYHIASLNKADSRVYNCKNLIESFIRESRIPYPYDDGVENSIY
ncbi:MAG: hypothetical protein IJZ23_09630 [Roseburia sp.]|nr:hypothetical protein [Roseburia sp.]